MWQGGPVKVPREIFVWGRGQEGQLGLGAVGDSATPVSVPALRSRHIVQVTQHPCREGLSLQILNTSHRLAMTASHLSVSQAIVMWGR